MSPSSDQPPRHFRASARRSVSLSATLLAGTGTLQEPVRLVDLGLRGAGVLLAETVPAGTTVSLALSAPQLWDPLQIGGTVAWVRELEGLTAAGIRFHHESPATLRALSELLEALLFV